MLYNVVESHLYYNLQYNILQIKLSYLPLIGNSRAYDMSIPVCQVSSIVKHPDDPLLKLSIPSVET
jgi:hypothetical protein